MEDDNALRMRCRADTGGVGGATGREVTRLGVERLTSRVLFGCDAPAPSLMLQ